MRKRLAASCLLSASLAPSTACGMVRLVSKTRVE